MKIWFGMQGNNEVLWDNWVVAINQWGRTPYVKTTNNQSMYIAETSIEYENSIGSSYCEKKNLPYPVIIDGWIDGKLVAKSDGIAISNEYDEGLYTTLKQDKNAIFSQSHGEFTMLWWDEKMQSLVIATDIYATRPVYYWINDRGEWFVSNDIRILLLNPEVPYIVDKTVCKMFPTSGFAVGENGFEDRTFFKGIKKVPAASFAYLNDFSVKVQNYWGISQLLNKNEIRTDATGSFRELLQEVTGDRLRDKKHIIELSGGLDSAAVTAAAIADNHKEQLLAVNISFAEPDMILSHDKDLVKNMMKDLGIPGIIILGDDTAKIPNAEIGRDPLWFVDGPDPRANSLVNETFTVIAKEHGVTSVLTGEGGDFVFSGEVTVIDSLIRQKRFVEAYHMLKKLADGRKEGMLKLGFQYGLAPFIPYIGENYYYKLLWADGEYDLPEYFTAEHRIREKEINQKDYSRYKKSQDLQLWGKRYHFDFLWPRARYMDSVGVTLPTYHPFLDRRLLEFAFSVSPEQHFDISKAKIEKYAGSKMLLRKAFTDILPSYVYNRSTKTTYAHMARKSFLNDRKHILQLFIPGERVLVAELGIIDREKWWKHLLAMAIRSEDPNNDLGVGYQYMRSVIDLEIWLRDAVKGKDHILERSRPRKPRIMADIETVNMSKENRYYSYS